MSPTAVRRRLSAVAASLAVTCLFTACATDPAASRDPSQSGDGTTRASTPQSAPVTTATATPEPTPAPDPLALKEGGRTATVSMNGDLLWHTDLPDNALAHGQANGTGTYDFSLLFQDVKEMISGVDMAICHEEVPFAPDGHPITGYPTFAAPREIAPYIKDTGWDLCTTASNHSLDAGFDGIVTTLDALDGAGILHTGTFRSPEERATPAIFTTDGGVRIGVVSGTYDTNGIPLPEGQEWSVAMLDPADMIARAEAAKAAGADIVVADIHGGDEYSMMPNQQQIDAATALTASPAVDLVYGQHVHTVQPWTKINDKWVVYGLGNMVASQLPENRRTFEGVTADFTFSERNDGTFTVTDAGYTPTFITSYWDTGEHARLFPVNRAMQEGLWDQARLQEALDNIREAVHALGAEGMTER